MDDFIGLPAVLMIFGIPMVAILASHQRKMAVLLHSQGQPAPNPETQALRQEIRELKELVHQQAIALDNLSRPLPRDERLHERVEAR